MWIVRSPKAKEKKNPASDSKVNSKCFIPKKIFPIKTTGRLIKKLSFSEVVLSNCLRSKVAMVDPERDSPGRAANPWTKPKTTASIFLKSRTFLKPSFLVFNCRNAVIRSRIPIPNVMIFPDKSI